MQKKENKRIIGKQKNLAAETDSQASEYNVVEKNKPSDDYFFALMFNLTGRTMFFGSRIVSRSSFVKMPSSRTKS